MTNFSEEELKSININFHNLIDRTLNDSVDKYSYEKTPYPIITNSHSVLSDNKYTNMYCYACYDYSITYILEEIDNKPVLRGEIIHRVNGNKKPYSITDN